MTVSTRLSAVAAVVLQALTWQAAAQPQIAGSHSYLPRWCGKPYQAGSPNYNPGGQLYPPTPSASPMLYARVEPRYSFFVPSDGTAAFIVDAGLSYTHGGPYYNSTSVAEAADQPFTELYFTIALTSNDKVLVSNQVAVNSTNNIFEFDLSELKPRTEAYNVVFYGASQDGNQTYSASTKLVYLPAKTTGSMTRIDNLNGGLWFANNVTDYAFEPYLPHGFYTDYGGYLDLSLENVDAYYELGYSVVHPIPTFSDNLTTILDHLDELDLKFMYDMRGSYTNMTAVQEQVEMIKDYTSLVMWYSADEPDGWQYPLNSTRLAYEQIRSLDMYHPVSLVLNCDNFYFEQYSAGADILMQDAYPFGINATWSIPWGTACNSTYGDCGCDDCVGELIDVSNRLDALANYQSYLGQWPKPLLSVPQAFDGEGYWNRNPSADETFADILLSFNHGSKGIVAWTFPTTTDLTIAYSQMAKVVTVEPVLSFLVGSQAQLITVAGHKLLDVACFVADGQMLVSVANLDYANTKAEIKIDLPAAAASILSTPWGSVEWTLSGNTLSAKGLPALATSLIILSL